MRLRLNYTYPVIEGSFKGNKEIISSYIFSPNMRQVNSGTEKGEIFA